MNPTCKQGYKFKDGKCERMKKKKGIFQKLKNSIKKKYNPFKMWGSYVGAVVYTLLIILSTKSDIYALKIVTLPMIPIVKMIVILTGCSGLGCVAYGFVVVFIIAPILGFLMGWGIHSLFRRFRR